MTIYVIRINNCKPCFDNTTTFGSVTTATGEITTETLQSGLPQDNRVCKTSAGVASASKHFDSELQSRTNQAEREAPNREKNNVRNPEQNNRPGDGIR